MRTGLACGLLSAVLLNLPFPLAGPLPPWRAVFSFFALVPLLYAVLDPRATAGPSYLWHSALCGYACGAPWYLLNCYWIYATMHVYGDLPVIVSAGILVLYSLILGLYFALFAFLVALCRRGAGRVLPALLVTPVLWVAVEYLAAHLTNVPWDQLGYAQVDNLVLTRLAPFTGVFGLSFVLASVNAALMGVFFAPTRRRRMRFASVGLVLMCALQLGSYLPAERSPVQAKAVLVQPDLKVGRGFDNDWTGRAWDEHAAEYLRLSELTCTPYLLGMPELAPQQVERLCPGPQPLATLVAWPESPAPFNERDPRLQTLMQQLVRATGATAVVGNAAVDPDGQYYNAGTVISPTGERLGRYDKIHLVPFGEYVPYAGLLSFAGHLTRNVSSFSRGTERTVFPLASPTGGPAHRFSVFICYEAVFASEIRLFAKNGAEVFVNISDDGWYGDTSAPWQHLNMARMRAIENRRWIVRDTNSGVTASIDPMGRVVESVPRHELVALTADYGYRSDLTFYTRHGDVFAALCAIACGIIAVASTVLGSAKSVSTRQVPRAERS
jgi:apolipoprotein N-acyltransferase